MSCGECPEWVKGYEDIKIKHKEEQKVNEPETSPAQEPAKEREKSWWDKFKDRFDPSGIGGLTPTPSYGI